MPTPILATKLYIPPPRPKMILRPHLTARLNEGLPRKLTLVSAPAGFGKTTLLSEWLSDRPRPAAWLSLDEADSDTARFLAYLIAALQTVAPGVGAGLVGVLQSTQPLPVESLLTLLLNDLAAVPDPLILVLDDYHMIDSAGVDQALAFLLEHLPPHMHLVIATREDPPLPLPRLRARGQLTELRAADLRFTPAEAAGFLNQVMGLKLSPQDVAALEARTEGWIAGLQLAAISVQGHPDAAGFIQSFTGSHRFVMDYLLEEVLNQQPASIQTFLLRTSILDRLCGPLCDAVVRDPQVSGQTTLEYLEQANLFLVPLDNQRRWYRYHHLFADLLRQRLSLIEQEQSQLDQQRAQPTGGAAEYHLRASVWYEDNGLEIEAFQHAAAAQDVARAARLMEGGGMPLLFRGAVTPVLHWLESLPKPVLDARPSLWVLYASTYLFISQLAGVEPRLQAAEAAIAASGDEPDETTRDLIGHIASVRATVAVTQHQADTILAQSRRALEYLHPNNLPVRTATTWTLGVAYQFQGERAAARQAFSEAIAVSQAIGHFIITLMATLGLASIQETDNQLPLAAETYRRALQLAGDPPMPVACEAHLGLARIFYEWNDLNLAEQHGQHSLRLSRQLEHTDRTAACQVFLARLKLAQGDAAGAAALLAQAGQAVRQHNFVLQAPEVAVAQVRVLLRQGRLAAAELLVQQMAQQLAQQRALPLSQARVHLAQGSPSAALAVLEPLRRQVEAKDWPDERLKVLVLQAVAFEALGEKDQAVQALIEALALAEPGGFIRTFVDEGPSLAKPLSEAAAQGRLPYDLTKLLAAFAAEQHRRESPPAQSLIEPLSPRELEVLHLIAQGLSNREISARLFLTENTVKGHNQKIFDKLQVQRRTEAIVRARELGLL